MEGSDLKIVAEIDLLDHATVALGHETFASPSGNIFDECFAEERTGPLAALDEAIQDRVGERDVEHNVRHVLVHAPEPLLHLFRRHDAGTVERTEQLANGHLGGLV